MARVAAPTPTAQDIRRLLWQRRLRLWWLLLRRLLRRFAILTGAILCAVLLVAAKLDIALVRFLQARAGDAAALVLDVMRLPLEAVGRVGETIGDIVAVWRENRRLEAENRRLLEWRREAIRLSVENQALRRMLAMPTLPLPVRRTAARVVADPGSAFAHTRLIDAGSERGIRVGMAVMDDRGLVGRVVAVGRWSARILLLLDSTSRIPVVVEPSGDHALLEGDNGPYPRLRFLPLEPRVSVGDRVITSGAGGRRPPGLPVGEVVAVDERGVKVRPYADWTRLDHVVVLDWQPPPPPPADAQPAPPIGPATAEAEP